MKKKQDKSKTARETALIGSLMFFHIWGTWLIYHPSDHGVKMFEAVCFGIFTNLGIIAGEKVLRLLVELKWGGKPKEATQ